MQTHADKTQEKKSQLNAAAGSKMQSSNDPAFQFVDNRPEAVAQRKLQELANNNALQEQPILKKTSPEPSRRENKTGLPDNLKSGVENLSGVSLDDVKVHRNSDKPAQLNAHAYAQGTDIHLASGQEKHLPHEAWHVVQQKQGRVKPTLQMKGMVNVNDDAGLEKEADVMGAKSINQGSDTTHFKKDSPVKHFDSDNRTTKVQRKVMAGQFNIIGEKHSDYKDGRANEKAMLKDWYKITEDKYWKETDFKGVEKTKEGKSKRADPIIEHCRVQLLGLISAIKDENTTATLLNEGVSEKVIIGIEKYWKSTYKSFLYLFHPDIEQAGKEYQDENYAVDESDKERLTAGQKVLEKADEAITELRSLKTKEGGKWFAWTELRNQKNQRDHVLGVRQLLHQVDQILGDVLYNIDESEKQDKIVNISREKAMVDAANRAVDDGFTGAWKIGTSHIKSMSDEKGPHAGTKDAKFTITDREEFLAEMKQYEVGKYGIVSLVPGEEVRDIPVPDSNERTGVKKEINTLNI